METYISGVWNEAASNRLRDMQQLLSLLKPTIPMRLGDGKVKSGNDVLLADFKPSFDTELTLFIYGDGTYGYKGGWVEEFEPLYIEGGLQINQLPTHAEVLAILRNE